MQAIGGYFELELPHFEEYHKNAIRLNSGRFCIEYILRCRKYTKVFVPYYICDTAIQAFERTDTTYAFYHLDKDFRIAENISLKENEALFYVNYWGLQTQYCRELADKFGNSLILDYTQAFFSRPIGGIDTFYSCRKFFGVPDGGYLYTDATNDFDIEQDLSFQRMDSLIKRIDISPEAGYEDFHRTSQLFHEISIRKMSKFTHRMMCGIDYNYVSSRRRENYSILQRILGGKELVADEVPMIFPYYIVDGQKMRKELIKNKVFVAKYWPNVAEYAGEHSLESTLADNILPLPIDQRYNEEDMNRIIKLMK